jgi:hypothetical protein
MEIRVKLNNLIREPRKFICLNDNIDYKLRTETAQLKSIIKNYYSGLLPLKSSFELSDSSASNNHNLIKNFEYSSSFALPHRNDDSLNKPIAQQNSQRMLFFLPLLVGLFALCVYVFKKIFLNGDDEKYFLDKSRSRSFGSRMNLMRKSPAKPSATHASKKLDTSGSKKHRVSNAFRRKMEDVESSDDDSDMISKFSDVSTSSSTSFSSTNRSANLSSTLINEPINTSSAFPSREGLSRKKKPSSAKKLNITTI